MRLVGIRYCGGCNPRYDRDRACGIIRQALSSRAQTEYAREGVSYDALAVIGGCTNCCASTDQFEVKGEIYRITSIEQAEEAAEALVRSLAEEGAGL